MAITIGEHGTKLSGLTYSNAPKEVAVAVAQGQPPLPAGSLCNDSAENWIGYKMTSWGELQAAEKRRRKEAKSRYGEEEKRSGCRLQSHRARAFAASPRSTREALVCLFAHGHSRADSAHRTIVGLSILHLLIPLHILIHIPESSLAFKT